MAVSERTLPEDGEEIQFATNHLGHFLFTNPVMNKLLVSANRALNAVQELSTLLALDTSSPHFDLVIMALKAYRSLAIASRMGMPELDPQGGYHPMIA